MSCVNISKYWEKNNIDFDQFVRVLLAKHVEKYNTERTKKKEECMRLDAKPPNVEKNTLLFVFSFLDHLTSVVT